MSLDVFKLDGRVALITGGNRGLGFALAQALAEAGANVVVTSRQQEKALESAATLARATGQRTMGLMVDVTDAAQIETMVQAVVIALITGSSRGRSRVRRSSFGSSGSRGDARPWS